MLLPFKFAPGAGGTVEASTTPGLITIGGGGSSADDGSDSSDGGAGDGGTSSSTAPTLALVDPSVTTHEAGTTWQDPGATATDTEDDDATLTSAIVVTGSVNKDTLECLYTDLRRDRRRRFGCSEHHPHSRSSGYYGSRHFLRVWGGY